MAALRPAVGALDPVVRPPPPGPRHSTTPSQRFVPPPPGQRPPWETCPKSILRSRRLARQKLRRRNLSGWQRPSSSAVSTAAPRSFESLLSGPTLFAETAPKEPG